MHQAIPYSNGRTWIRPTSPSANGTTAEATTPSLSPSPSPSSGDGVRRAVAENPVAVVGRRGCCMSHVVKLLLQGLGVNPTVYEVNDGSADEAAILEEFADAAPPRGGGGTASDGVVLPAVFIGGRLVGGLDRLMAVHISGELIPILKEAGALWL
ncbi:monothiol glutaredoxin-S9-like [Typha angustifolia]|uniref:monothiol glutaredoxin-S9-like n=1 Tax=Typha angustifolia TaxID=59011 RepID=UPI003C2AB020